MRNPLINTNWSISNNNNFSRTTLILLITTDYSLESNTLLRKLGLQSMVKETVK